MTSFGCNKIIQDYGYMPSFKIQGKVYHIIGNLLPGTQNKAEFLQIYFLGQEKLETEDVQFFNQ